MQQSYKTQLYIGGRHAGSSNGSTFKVKNPATQVVLGEVGLYESQERKIVAYSSYPALICAATTA